MWWRGGVGVGCDGGGGGGGHFGLVVVEVVMIVLVLVVLKIAVLVATTKNLQPYVPPLTSPPHIKFYRFLHEIFSLQNIKPSSLAYF